jgi:ABC-type cobalamin/Fe3+-siderophores transport system ATPase subunit
MTYAPDGVPARAYPLRYLTWHEIVNDSVAGVPIAVTFCPLCNTALVFDRRVDGDILTFGVSGNLRHSDMVMFDRETESWWQQATGEGIVGAACGHAADTARVLGRKLGELSAAHPDGLVMAQPERQPPLWAQPLRGLRQHLPTLPLFRRDAAPRYPAGRARGPRGRARLAADAAGRGRRGDRGRAHPDWAAGKASALDAPRIAEGRDVGQIRVRDADGADMVHDVMFALPSTPSGPKGSGCWATDGGSRASGDDPPRRGCCLRREFFARMKGKPCSPSSWQRKLRGEPKAGGRAPTPGGRRAGVSPRARAMPKAAQKPAHRKRRRRRRNPSMRALTPVAPPHSSRPMAQAPLLQISGLTLGFGGPPVFDGLDLVVQAGDRLALVGRNGSGKSTLMKVMAGLVEPDAGTRVLPDGTGVGYLEQDPRFRRGSRRSAISRPRALARRRPGAWRRRPKGSTLISRHARRTAPRAGNGGARRLRGLLAEAPDLMLLDEPTNHLDIAAIAWLEAELARTRAAFIAISHDRAFLRRLARATLWLDRGVVRRMDRPFDAFEDWRDEIWARGGPRATQARPQDQGRGALGRRGHLRPAQAQPGPGAGAAASCARPARR